MIGEQIDSNDVPDEGDVASGRKYGGAIADVLVHWVLRRRAAGSDEQLDGEHSLFSNSDPALMDAGRVSDGAIAAAVIGGILAHLLAFCAVYVYGFVFGARTPIFYGNAPPLIYGNGGGAMAVLWLCAFYISFYTVLFPLAITLAGAALGLLVRDKLRLKWANRKGKREADSRLPNSAGWESAGRSRGDDA